MMATCPTCGRAQLSEQPHVHPPRRPQPPLGCVHGRAAGMPCPWCLGINTIPLGGWGLPDPLTVEDDRIPRHPRDRLVPDSPRRGCSVLPWLVVAVVLAVWRG